LVYGILLQQPELTKTCPKIINVAGKGGKKIFKSYFDKSSIPLAKNLFRKHILEWLPILDLSRRNSENLRTSDSLQHAHFTNEVPLSSRNMLQYPQWMPETTNSIQP
jgi:hypothetical protein